MSLFTCCRAYSYSIGNIGICFRLCDNIVNYICHICYNLAIFRFLKIQINPLPCINQNTGSCAHFVHEMQKVFMSADVQFLKICRLVSGKYLEVFRVTDCLQKVSKPLVFTLWICSVQKCRGLHTACSYSLLSSMLKTLLRHKKQNLSTTCYLFRFSLHYRQLSLSCIKPLVHDLALPKY